MIRGLALSASGLSLFGSMFLPWYSLEQSEFQRRAAEALRQFGATSTTNTSPNAVEALDFIALALFTMGLISLVLGLAIAFAPRGEGEGGAVGVLGATGTAAGLVAAGMIAYRILVLPDSDYSLDYGILVALGTAALMILAGLATATSRTATAGPPPAPPPVRTRPTAAGVGRTEPRPAAATAGKRPAGPTVGKAKKGAPRPGWYRDRRGDARLRWWDGERWTEETSD